MDEKAHQKRNKAVWEFVDSDGWKYVKDDLIKKINDLQSLMNVEGETPEQVMLDIKVRKNVIAILLEWIKDVEGQVDQHIGNNFSPDESEIIHIIRE
jgi:hypothetical protein